MISSPSIYLLFFIGIAFVNFTDAYNLGRINHPSASKPNYTTELRNASRYCGNGFYLYLTKLVDIGDPNEEEQWTKEYVGRICTARVIDNIIHVNHTKYIDSKQANVTWGADFKMNDTHYFLISEHFEQHDEADENDSETAEVPVVKSTTMDPASLMGLRRYFIKCTSDNCPLSDNVAIAYNAIVGYSNGEMQQQFTLNKNALLDENRHLISKYHFNYDEHGLETVSNTDSIAQRTYCPPGCVPENQIRKTRQDEVSLKTELHNKNRANVVIASAVSVFITLSLVF